MRVILKSIAKSMLLFLAVCSVVTSIYFALTLKRLELNTNSQKSVEAVATELVERKLLPSISYAVIANGQIKTSKTIGIADMKTGALTDSNTLYEAASLTKPVVAEIARRLFKAGKFDLDEKITDTVSISRISDRAAAEKITPRQLLTHTSGLPNWSGDSHDPNRKDPLTLNFEPGAEFLYSGEGYGILLTFLEAKSGQSAEVLSMSLFEELGMVKSTLIAKKVDGQFARGHWAMSPGRQAWRTAEPIAAYSLFTNASDYVIFLKYVITEHSNDLADDGPFPEIQTQVTSSTSENPLGWSLGWGTLKTADGIKYFQWGDNGAFRSFAAFDPISGDGIVYFTNGSYGTIYADELSAPVLGDVSTASSWFSGPATEIARSWLRF